MSEQEPISRHIEEITPEDIKRFLERSPDFKSLRDWIMHHNVNLADDLPVIAEFYSRDANKKEGFVDGAAFIIALLTEEKNKQVLEQIWDSDMPLSVGDGGEDPQPSA